MTAVTEQQDRNSPVFDEGLEVKGKAHAERQQRRIFLQNFGQNLKVCLAVLVGKLSCGQLHLEDIIIQSQTQLLHRLKKAIEKKNIE